MFLRKKDYYSLIQSEDLEVVLSQTDTFRIDREKAAQEEVASYIRNRYNDKKIFKDILAYSDSTQFNIEDLIEWTETAWSDATTYALDDRISYSGKIYISLQGSNLDKQPDTETSWWTELADNESLWACKVASLGNLPSTSFVYTTNLFTGGHDQITGWDKGTTSTLYFKRDEDYDDRVYIYSTSADRTADTNRYGWFKYDKTGIQFPYTAKIEEAEEETLSGYINIIGYIPDSQEWTVVASNYFVEEDNRNQKLVEIMLDVTVYHLFSRIQPRNIPDIRLIRYDGNDAMQNGGAIGYLKRIQKGTVTIDLPLYDYNKDKGNNITWNSSPKRKLNY